MSPEIKTESADPLENIFLRIKKREGVLTAEKINEIIYKYNLNNGVQTGEGAAHFTFTARDLIICAVFLDVLNKKGTLDAESLFEISTPKIVELINQTHIPKFHLYRSISGWEALDTAYQSNIVKLDQTMREALWHLTSEHYFILNEKRDFEFNPKPDAE